MAADYVIGILCLRDYPRTWPTVRRSGPIGLAHTLIDLENLAGLLTADSNQGRLQALPFVDREPLLRVQRSKWLQYNFRPIACRSVLLKTGT